MSLLQLLIVLVGIQTRDGEMIPVTVKVGDKVLLPEYGGIQVKIDGEEVYLFTNHEILAKYT
jgi:chaperonin GroES